MFNWWFRGYFELIIVSIGTFQILLFNVPEYKKVSAFTIGFVLLTDEMEKLSLDFLLLVLDKLCTCIVNSTVLVRLGVREKL